MNSQRNSSSDNDNDAGAPMPDFRAPNIRLQTIAPALGVVDRSPDYLEYDTRGRGVVVTLFANSGVAYLMGIAGGGLYGFRQGLLSTPSHRFRVQLNSVLNHCGRYGSRAGNTVGVFAVLYSLYEGLADHVRVVALCCLTFSPLSAPGRHLLANHFLRLFFSSSFHPFSPT
jgi:Tim17/Tim22/Tim23/Pmp24 family